MSVAELMTFLGGTGGGVGVIILFLFVTGHIVPKSRVDEIKEERDEWKHMAEVERQRADNLAVTGQIVRDVMTGLHKELS